MAQTTACPRCATPLPDSARFCPGCGATTPTGFTPVDSERPSSPTQGAELAARRAEIQKALGTAWELRGLIGQGGFGEVWAAFDTKLKRDVAVKTLRSDLVASPAMLTRFQREAESVARLRHPHIVPIYQVGEAEGLAFFVMPLVRGASLQAVLTKEGKLSIDESRRIVAEAASALHAAHEAGIVHRDIKPENIMLDGSERRVLLMDFGIARAVGSDDEGRLTGTGLVIGTPQYMSPEQASAEREIDHRSDIYSLGVVAFQMLAGRQLFDTNSARSLVMHHIATEPVDLRSLRSEVPDDVADAIAKCLKKAPAERWNSAGELAKAIGPATTSAASRMPSIIRRLRPYSKKAAYRSLAYIGGLVVLLAATALINPAILKDSWRAWFGGTVTVETPFAPSGATNSQQFRSIFAYLGTNRYRSRDVQLVSLNDTALLASSPVGGPMVFNGSTWRGLDVPTESWIFPPVMLQGSLWIAAEGLFGRTVLYEMTRSGAVARDTLPIRAYSIWSDGRTMLVGSNDGAMMRGRPTQWQREPTGITNAVLTLWGNSQEQFGLAASQLLLFNGMNWRRTDLRSDTTVRLSLQTGAMLRDGNAVATACRKVSCEPQLWLRDKASGRWKLGSPRLPQGLVPYGVAGASISDFYVYGAPGEPACMTGTCLYHVVNDQSTPVESVKGDFHVIGVASLRGVPYALASSGALYTVRNGEWGVISEIPAALMRGVAVGPQTRIAWGYGLKVETSWRGLTPRQRPNVRDIAIGFDAKSGTETIWILDERGALSSTTCRRSTGECAGERPVSPPDQRRILDLEVGPDAQLWVGGERGLIAHLTGEQWTAVRSGSGQDAGDIISLSLRADRPWFALTNGNVLAIDARGTTKPWREVGASFGAGKKIIGVPAGGAVVLAEGGAFLLSAQGGTSPFDSPTGTATSIEVLDDGRALVGFARPDDPLVGGSLVIHYVGKFGPGNSRRIPIPQAMDVYGLAFANDAIYAAGSGGFWFSGSVSKLPSVK